MIKLIFYLEYMIESRFYFDIDPFEIDSLDSYNRSSLSFPGEFNSGNIIPNFRQELRVQQDNSLGFEIHIPKMDTNFMVGKDIFILITN